MKYAKEKSKSWPSVSIAIAAFNSARTIDQCLESIKKQQYPAKVEIIIADGGSADDTLSIARKYNTKCISVPPSRQNAEYNKGVAANIAKNEILLMVDHDNILPHKNWLKNMVQPLVDNENIFGSGVFKFHYDRRMTILDRYFALFGATDPIPYFFNKSAHQSWMYDGFHLRGKVVKDKPGYYIVNLNPERMPALGANGSVLRVKLLKQLKLSPDRFFHIDAHVDLARKGYVEYAFVKDTIIHLTHNKLVPFLRRRRYFMEKYHFVDKSKRRYSIYEPDKDRLLLIGFIFYSLSVVLPFIDSTRGFLKIRDVAWFVHPVMCLCILFLYGVTYLREGVKHVFLAR